MKFFSDAKDSLLGCVMIMILMLLINIDGNAQPKVEKVSYGLNQDVIVAGYTRDEEYVAYIEKGPTQYTVVKTAVNTYDIQYYSFSATYVDDAVISPDGKRIVWLEKDIYLDADQLHMYDFETETASQINLPELPDTGDEKILVKSLNFIKQTGHLTYVMGFGYEIKLYNTLVKHDIQNGTFELITVENLPIDYGSLVFSSYEFSDDGSRLLYYTTIRYVAGDCCFSDEGYLVLMDVAGMQAQVVIDLRESNRYSAIALAGNGQSFIYQNNEQIIQYQIDSGEARTIDVKGLDGSINSRLNWLQLSTDGSVMTLLGLGQFSDGNEFSQQHKFQEYQGGQISNIRRPGVLIAQNLLTGESTTLNKYNGVQLYSVQPFYLNAAGSSVFYVTKQIGLYGRYNHQLLIDHPIQFEGFKADLSLTGAWYNSDNPGQGIFVSVVPQSNQEPNKPLLTWYTVNNEGQPYWLLIEGEFIDNAITGNAYLVTGSQFGVNYQTADTETIMWGQVTMTFDDCRTASVSYQPVLDGFMAGQIEMSRLTTQAGLGCL